jgi:hypothetical protein
MKNAYALVVGIADYQHVRKLPQVQDAEHVAQLLTDPAYCGYAAENVHLLLDAQATQAALRHELAGLAGRADAGSTVFIYFSGHGGRVEGGAAAGEYLLPVDAVYPSDQDLARTAVSGKEFSEALRKIPARKVVVVFDCCHAGGVGEPKDLTSLPLRPGLTDGTYADALASGVGRVIFASSRATEVSLVPSGATYGLFTEHFLAGLRGGVASDDGYVRVFELFKYVQPRVTVANPRQHPVLKFEAEEDFALALYRGGQKGVVPRTDDGFRYDAYVSFADKDPDDAWVRDTLVPRLRDAGLRVALSEDVEEPGVERVVSRSEGVQQAKRTVVVLSEAYLDDSWAAFDNVLVHTLQVEERSYRLLPVKWTGLDPQRVPLRLRSLAALDLGHPRRAGQEFQRLVKALQGPLPKRETRS